jgi:transmembrane sensor
MNRERKTDCGRAGAEELSLSAAIREAAADWVARRDAGLSPREECEYAAWLEASPAHRAAVDRLDFTWRTLDRPLTTGTADAVLCELEHRATARRRRSVALTAAALVMLVGAGIGWQSLRPAPVLRSAPATTAAVLLPSLQSLPDGSVAELRDGAEIAVEFDGAQRRVILRRGEAYFKVTKNTQRPFVVVAGGVEVRAVGTAFSVDLGQGEVEVLVTEGNVAVEVAPQAPRPDGVPRPQPFLIGAGGGAIVRAAPPRAESAISPLAKVDLQTRLAWRSPRLEFSGTPLLEAVALINRYNHVQFIIEDPELARTRVSGNFGAVNTDAFVRLLEAGFNVQPERRGDDEIILRRQR